MPRKRPSRPCRQCGRNTKSITGWCDRHRPIDAIPIVHRVGGGISFAGHTYTDAQARHLADTIHDVLEGEQHQ